MSEIPCPKCGEVNKASAIWCIRCRYLLRPAALTPEKIQKRKELGYEQL